MSFKLIEQYLPLDALARAAESEARAGAGAPSSLHLWWGNRQLAIARALVFAQLVNAPEFGDLERTKETHDILRGLLDGDPLVELRARELIRESCGGVRQSRAGRTGYRVRRNRLWMKNRKYG